MEQIRHAFGLDHSKPYQYFHYMKGVVTHFDFGYSYQNNQSVRSLIFDRLPATIYLTVGAVLVWLSIAIPVGLVSSLKRRSIFDRLSMGGALLAISAPVYWLGLVALYLFAADIGKFHVFLGAGSTARPARGSRTSPARCCSRGWCCRRRSPRSTRASCGRTCSR